MRVVTNMGVTNKGCMKKYWNTKDFSQSNPYFPSIFTRDIFFILRSMLHFPQLDGNCSMLEKKFNELFIILVNYFVHILPLNSMSVLMKY